MEIKYTVNGQEYTEEVSPEDLEAAIEHYDKMTKQEARALLLERIGDPEEASEYDDYHCDSA